MSTSSEIHLVRNQDDVTEFEALTAQLRHELHPATALETVLFKEIARASWRLERCGRTEAAAVDDVQQPALDRARSTALNIILKATAELRRLQTSRLIGLETLPEGADLSSHGIANEREIIAALASNERRRTIRRKTEPDSSFCKTAPSEAPPPETPAAPASEPDSSFCKTAETPAKPAIPRGGPCPCGSPKKYKRCCGRNAPPVLHHGAGRPKPKAA